MITVVDDYNPPTQIQPNLLQIAIKQGFILINGSLREVKYIHQTQNGTQIELFL